MKKFLRDNRSHIIIFLAVLVLWFPIFLKPQLFLGRDNDLNEFFWPIYNFTKDQIINHHIFPLWNNVFLSGTPLLPDPQSPLFYLPNIIFLIFPLDKAFILISILHIFLGGIGIYLLCKRGFNFSNKASLISAVIYVFTPRLSGYITAGHVGLIETWAWVPYVMFSVLMLVKQQKSKWGLLLGIAMSALFFTHTYTFLIISFVSLIGLFISYKYYKLESYKIFFYYLVGAIIAFGLCAVTLIPQYLWQELTNRTLLINKPQIFPIWTSKLEFIKAVFVPWTMNGGISKIVTEKWIVAGIFASIVSFLSLIKINKKILIPFLFLSVVVLFITLGNISPVYSILIRMDWFKVMRIPPRVWVIFLIVIPILVGYAVDRYKGKFIVLMSYAVILETLFLSWAHILKPVIIKPPVPEEIYNIITQDKEIFRVICLDRCISQKEASIRHIELVDGYSTLTQLNYYQQSWQLTGSFWDYYVLTTPPESVFLFEDLQPSSKSLGEYNTKYVLSNHPLTDNGYVLVKKVENIYLYKIKSFVTRDYKIYSPNFIRTKNINDKSKTGLVIPEVYSPGWTAYLNGNERISILETPISQRYVNIKPDTEFVDLKYSPPGYKLGLSISLTTLLLLLIYYLTIKYKQTE